MTDTHIDHKKDDDGINDDDSDDGDSFCISLVFQKQIEALSFHV